MRNNRAAEKRNEISMAAYECEWWQARQAITGKLKSVESLDQTNEMERGLSNATQFITQAPSAIGLFRVRATSWHRTALSIVRGEPGRRH